MHAANEAVIISTLWFSHAGDHSSRVFYFLRFLISLDYGPKTVLACFMATTTAAQGSPYHCVPLYGLGSRHETATFNTLLGHLLCRCLDNSWLLHWSIISLRPHGAEGSIQLLRSREKSSAHSQSHLRKKKKNIPSTSINRASFLSPENFSQFYVPPQISAAGSGYPNQPILP